MMRSSGISTTSRAFLFVDPGDFLAGTRVSSHRRCDFHFKPANVEGVVEEARAPGRTWPRDGRIFPHCRLPGPGTPLVVELLGDRARAGGRSSLTFLALSTKAGWQRPVANR